MELDVRGLTAWHAPARVIAPVLADVTFTLPAGGVGVVLGPSGSGKTTLLRAIAGLHPLVEGDVTLGGVPIDSLRPEQRGVGLVPQDSALFPTLTVQENIEFGLARRRRRGARTDEMLELLALGALRGRLPHQISGGQAQRVAVARALAPAPRLLLLDEPFSALDASLRAEVRESIRGALRETGTTSLFVTHDQDEALSLATRLVVLAAGAVRQTGTPSEVYANPADVWTGRFVGDANILSATTGGTTAMTTLGLLRHQPVPPGRAVLLVRPEQIRVAAQTTVPTVIGTVRSARYFGHDGMLEVALDDGAVVLVRVQAHDMRQPGVCVQLHVPGEVRAYSET